MGNSQISPKQWPNAKEMKAKIHTNMHAHMVQNISIKEQLLSTLKRDKHGHMACILSSENHVIKVPNQVNKTSQACNNVQASRGLKPKLYEARPKGPGGPKTGPMQV